MRSKNTFLYSLVLVSLAVLAYYALFQHITPDEVAHVHMGWLVSQDLMPIRDFLCPYHPLFYYATSWLYHVFAEGLPLIVAVRMFMFVISMLISWGTYVLARHCVGDKTVALMSVLLLNSVYVYTDTVVEIRPDSLEVCLALWALIGLYQYVKCSRLPYLIGGTLALIASFAASQKIVFLIGLIGLWWLGLAIKKKIPLSALLWFCALWLSALLGGAVALGFFGLWKSYVVNCWAYPFLSFTSGGDLLPLLRRDWFSLLVFIGGSWPFLRAKKGPVFLFVFPLVLLVIHIKTLSLEQYFQDLVPFAAIVGACGLNAVLKEKRLLLYVLMGINLFYTDRRMVHDVRKYSLKDSLKKIEYVRSDTSPQDCVYDGYFRFNIFRRDADYFWFYVNPNSLSLYQSLTHYDYDIYQIIEQKKPKIVSSFQLDALHPLIQKHYRKDLVYPDLWIRKEA